ncbi:MAG: hypothetical protein FJZ96_12650 [Chloroflexi bacterium]|nr:hypothetical protein [Chloroflexota bacterium]
MDHRPFEDWLLEDKPLNKEERLALHEHLRACAACNTLTEVDLALRNTRLTAPADGFTTRFQVRLEMERKVRRQRQRWGFLFLTLGVLAILLWVGWPLLAALSQSPAGMIYSWLASLAHLTLLAQTVGEALSVLLDVVPAFVPPAFWMMVISAFGLVGLAWVVSLRKFSRIPQGA